MSLPLFCTTTKWNFQIHPSYTFYRTNVVLCSCSLFFSLPLIFTPVVANIFPFCHYRYKFLCFSSNEIGLLWFLSLALALSLLYTSMKTLKLSRKKESAFVVVVFISKRPGSYAIYRRNAGVKKLHPGLHERVDVSTDVPRTDDFLRTKISWMHRIPNFLTHGAPHPRRPRGR